MAARVRALRPQASAQPEGVDELAERRSDRESGGGVGNAPGARIGPRRLAWGWIVLIQVAVIVVAAWVWQLLVDHGVLTEIYVSRPTEIGKALYHSLGDPQVTNALKGTLEETVAGFLIASALGVLFGLAAYQVSVIERVTRPFMTAANNMPRLALTPLFILWFGVGFQSHVVLIISMVFFVVAMNTYAGFISTDRDHLMLARVLGVSRRKLFITFIFPSAAPSIFVGLQLGLAYSFMGAVVGEIISGGNGLGALVAIYSAAYDSAKLFAILVIMAIVATVLSGIMRLIEKFVLRWREHELRGTR